MARYSLFVLLNSKETLDHGFSGHSRFDKTLHQTAFDKILPANNENWKQHVLL